MLPTINFNNMGAFIQGQTIPKVHGSSEANRYPTPINSEVVLLDDEDDSIIYYKKTDVNGYSTVSRKRWFDDPEPTQEEINDKKYLTINEFNEFKKEVLNGQRAILESINANTKSNNGSSEHNRSNDGDRKQKFKPNGNDRTNG